MLKKMELAETEMVLGGATLDFGLFKVTGTVGDLDHIGGSIVPPSASYGTWDVAVTYTPPPQSNQTWANDANRNAAALDNYNTVHYNSPALYDTGRRYFP